MTKDQALRLMMRGACIERYVIELIPIIEDAIDRTLTTSPPDLFDNIETIPLSEFKAMIR